MIGHMSNPAFNELIQHLAQVAVERQILPQRAADMTLAAWYWFWRAVHPDEAEDKNAVVQAAMQEPLFVELADACREVVDAEDK